MEKVIRKVIEELSDSSLAKVISKLNEKQTEDIKEKPKTVKTEALHGPMVTRKGRDGHEWMDEWDGSRE